MEKNVLTSRYGPSFLAEKLPLRLVLICARHL
jgi:hypothetical protein